MKILIKTNNDLYKVYDTREKVCTGYMQKLTELYKGNKLDFIRKYKGNARREIREFGFSIILEFEKDEDLMMKIPEYFL